jgi:hypothetical protein
MIENISMLVGEPLGGQHREHERQTKHGRSHDSQPLFNLFDK